MMTLKVSILFATFAVVVSGSVKVSEIANKADILRIKKGFKLVESMLNDNFEGTTIENPGSFLAILTRSVDMNCAVEQLRKPKEIKDTLNEILNVEGRNRTSKEETSLVYILLKISIPCSNKSRPVSDFVFDALMSLGHLVRAFKDEPEIQKYTKTPLKCLNAYAVKNKLINAAEYPIDYKLNSETDETETCTELFAFAIGLLNEFMDDEPECMKVFIRKRVDNWLRAILLLQVKLTPEQRKIESDRWFNDEMELIKNEGTCALQSLAMESSSESDEEENEIFRAIKSKITLYDQTEFNDDADALQYLNRLNMNRKNVELI